jgi:hypothetical protein
VKAASHSREKRSTFIAMEHEDRITVPTITYETETARG